jgi:hypothetical protein
VKDALFSKEGKEAKNEKEAEEQKKEMLLAHFDGHGFY